MSGFNQTYTDGWNAALAEMSVVIRNRIDIWTNTGLRDPDVHMVNYYNSKITELKSLLKDISVYNA